MTNRMDHDCVCQHSADTHKDGTGRCDFIWPASLASCSCRRFRSYIDWKALKREDHYWSKVGVY